MEDTAAVLLPEASAQLCINCFEVILTMVMSLIVSLMVMGMVIEMVLTRY